MAEVGRPTKLDDEFYLKIKALVLEGKDMVEVAEALEVPHKTCRCCEGEHSRLLILVLVLLLRR
jgi:hypothetical protein